MYDYGAGLNGGGGVGIVTGAELVVVNNNVVLLFPDFHPQFVHSTAPIGLTVRSRQDERVIAFTINRPRASVLRLGPGNDQPIIARAVEVKVSNLELELSLS